MIQVWTATATEQQDSRHYIHNLQMDCLGVPGAGYMPTRKESCNGLILPKKNIGNFSSKIQKTIHLIFHKLILQTMNTCAYVPFRFDKF